MRNIYDFRRHKPAMEKHSYGKNIWARVEKYYSTNTDLNNTENKICC